MRNSKAFSSAISLLTFLYLINFNYIKFDLIIINLDFPKLLTIILLFAIILQAIRRRTFNLSSNRSLISLILLFIFWAVLSLFWVPVVDFATTEIANLIIVLFLCIVLSTGFNASHIAFGWLAGYLYNLIVALWELFTNRHLPGSDYVNNPINSVALQGEIILASFNNPNDYSAFLLLSNSIFYYLIRNNRNAIAWMVPFVGINTILLFYAAGRLGIIGSVIFLVCLIVLSKKSIGNLLQTAILTSSATTVYLYAYTFSGLAVRKINSALSIYQDESILSRINLSLNGIYLLFITNGLGVGAGGYTFHAESLTLPYYTYGIVNPHNFWIEVASQYGLIVFIALLYWIARCFVKAYKARAMADNKSRYIFVVTAILTYSIAVIQSSSYLNSFSNWIYLILIGGVIGKLKS